MSQTEGTIIISESEFTKIVNKLMKLRSETSSTSVKTTVSEICEILNNGKRCPAK